jgi:hypothetical protein
MPTLLGWETPAGGIGSLGFVCTGLGWDGTNIIIGDFFNSRIVKTTIHGVYVGEIILGGSPPPNSVQGVAYDTLRGHYWVAHYAEDGSGTVRRYNAAGVLQQTIASPHSGPNGITYDAVNDRILVISNIDPMIEYDITTGLEVASININGDGLELDPSDANALWVSIDTSPPGVIKYNRTTAAVITSWAAPESVEDITFISGVFHMALDQELHVGTKHGNRIRTFDKTNGTEIVTDSKDYTIHELLIFHYALGEASGTRADGIDGNDLTDVNTVTQIAGKVGNAAHFTQANAEQLTHVSNIGLESGNIALTYFFWALLDDKATVKGLLTRWDGAGDQRELAAYYSQGDDRFLFAVDPAGIGDSVSVLANTFGAPPTATWCFIVIEHNEQDDTISIQINNGAKDTQAHATGIFHGTSVLRLGSFANVPTFFHDGGLDEVGMLKAILSPAERTLLWNGGSGLSLTELIAAETVATPAISPNGGSFVVATEVTLACGTSGASIYYTLDGSTPDATKTLYTAPFTLSADATVKAIGIKAGLTNSAVASSAFTVTGPGGGKSSKKGYIVHKRRTK